MNVTTTPENAEKVDVARHQIPTVGVRAAITVVVPMATEAVSAVLTLLFLDLLVDHIIAKRFAVLVVKVVVVVIVPIVVVTPLLVVVVVLLTLLKVVIVVVVTLISVDVLLKVDSVAEIVAVISLVLLRPLMLLLLTAVMDFLLLLHKQPPFQLLGRLRLHVRHRRRGNLLLHMLLRRHRLSILLE